MRIQKLPIFLAIVAIVAILEASAVHAAFAWERASALAWGSLIGGPAFLVLFHASLATDPRPLARWSAAWLPVASLFGLLSGILGFVLPPGSATTDSAASAAALYAGLLIVCATAIALAWPRAPRDVRMRSLRLAPIAIALVPLPLGENILLTSVLAIEIVALLDAVGFRRPVLAWTRASAGAIATIAIGVGVVLLARGSPRLELAEGEWVSVMGPLALAAALVFLALLMTSGRVGPTAALKA